jgi:AcrR family transcriptional regulator
MSKESTKKQILDAVAHLLATKGFQAIGINAIAREAGVDKVLIYRYFENLPMLLKIFAKHEEFWPTFEQLLGTDIDQIPGLDPTDLLINLFTNQLKELRKRPTTQAILCWELFQRNELTDALTNAHEEQGAELIKLTPEELQDVPGVDVPAVLSLIHAGINFLVLRSKTTQFYGGVDIQSEKGWKQLESGIQTIIKAFMAYCRSQKETGQ